MKEFFQRLFKPSAGQELDVPTRPLSSESTESIVPLSPVRVELPQFVVGCAQSVGKQRNHNEDAMFSLTTNLTSNHSNPPFGLYIVADGMGGHQHGEVASDIAVRSMAGYIVRNLLAHLVSLKPGKPEESLQEIMQASVDEAHRMITRQVPGGGTTVTAALILGDQMTLAHVGDSRAYQINPDGVIHTLTRDHSLVKRMVELGQISQDEAAIHPQRNVLYRALGQGEPFEPDINTLKLPGAGFLLLCSDGLWGLVPEEEISRIVLNTPSPAQACQKLVDAANAAGGPDNITAVLIQLPAEKD